MIHFRDEGQMVRQGLNIYPRKSSSIGFIIRICDWKWAVRYSKIVKRWFIGVKNDRP